MVCRCEPWPASPATAVGCDPRERAGFRLGRSAGLPPDTWEVPQCNNVDATPSLESVGASPATRRSLPSKTSLGRYFVVDSQAPHLASDDALLTLIAASHVASAIPPLAPRATATTQPHHHDYAPRTRTRSSTFPAPARPRPRAPAPARPRPRPPHPNHHDHAPPHPHPRPHPNDPSHAHLAAPASRALLASPRAVGSRSVAAGVRWDGAEVATSF